MKQKVLYVAALMLLSSSFGMAKKKVEDPEITKMKAKIENVMSQVDKQPDWLYSRLQMFWKTQASFKRLFHTFAAEFKNNSQRYETDS